MRKRPLILFGFLAACVVGLEGHRLVTSRPTATTKVDIATADIHRAKRLTTPRWTYVGYTGDARNMVAFFIDTANLHVLRGGEVQYWTRVTYRKRQHSTTSYKRVYDSEIYLTELSSDHQFARKIDQVMYLGDKPVERDPSPGSRLDRFLGARLIPGTTGADHAHRVLWFVKHGPPELSPARKKLRRSLGLEDEDS